MQIICKISQNIRNQVPNFYFFKTNIHKDWYKGNEENLLANLPIRNLYAKFSSAAEADVAS